MIAPDTKKRITGDAKHSLLSPVAIKQRERALRALRHLIEVLDYEVGSDLEAFRLADPDGQLRRRLSGHARNVGKQRQKDEQGRIAREERDAAKLAKLKAANKAIQSTRVTLVPKSPRS